ncbi:MAG: class I SAM-dependent methyltransferase [Proteobacteria bacterium]|nr:class I SAM-dependent methyltransferase [Pseudomonadota bacterium]MBI3497519.1 class I SAM-dependent methyltransferase [Pseudomonadota bacterium]
MTLEVTRGQRTTASAAAAPGPGRWSRLLLMIAKQIQRGTVTIVTPDGAHHRFAADKPGPEATLVMHRERVARRLLAGGDVPFAEAYMDGDWDSPSLTQLIELAALNGDVVDRHLQERFWGRIVRRLMHALHRNSKLGSRRNIAYHYDLGNDFYRTWLDASMTYSSALFADPKLTLEAAQRAKYIRLARMLDLDPAHHVLEIGCGWGGFIETAVASHGCRVTGITLSRAQQAYAVRRLDQAGLAERASIRLQDYRDVEERFDRIASIEMFEAVGEAYWPTFFRVLHDRLRQGGLAALQVITIAEDRFEAYRQRPDFIQRYIFPGGMLPSLERLKAIVAEVGLEWREDCSFGQDYARTLKLWGDRFLAAWPQLNELGFDERFRRMWQYYLAYCEAGFRAATIDVRQILLARG